MSAPVSSIRNLGPASDKAFANAGIHTADQLRELGPDKAYAMLLAAGTRPHFIGYYAMVMGLQGRPWNDCQGGEKQTLRARFDQIVALTQPTPRSALKQALDEIGVQI